MPSLNSSVGDILTTAYSASVFELTQQRMSKLRGAVSVEPLPAEDKLFPRIASQEVQQLQERSPLIVPSNIQWDNRRLAAGRVGIPFYVDKLDVERMLVDPKSVLAMRAAEALERNLDRVVIQSFTAPAMTGRNGTVPITAANDGVVTIDATSGFTYDTLLQIKEQFQSVELGTHGGTDEGMKMYLIVSEQEHAKLMREGTLINSLYTQRGSAVDRGSLDMVLDFELIVYGSGVPYPMLPVTNNVRACYAICSGAVTLGITQNWETELEKVNARWQTWQVLASGVVGATRMEGARVVQINTTPGQ
jgi:hypothetical protein